MEEKIRNNLIAAFVLFFTGLLSSVSVLMGLAIIPLIRACYLDIVYNMAIDRAVKELFGRKW